MQKVAVWNVFEDFPRFGRAVFLALLLGVFSAGNVLAAGWKVSRLRGDAQILVQGQWKDLRRGDTVPLRHFVRTGEDAKMRLSRGGEVVDMEPKSEVQILENAGGRNTVVHQRTGEISVEANRRKTKHFAVQTRFLVAVVKGTRFTVRADQRVADVSVSRGRVEVRDILRNRTVDVTPNQRAEAGYGRNLVNEGQGKLDRVSKFKGSPYQPEVEKVRPPKPENKGQDGKEKAKNKVENKSQKAGLDAEDAPKTLFDIFKGKSDKKDQSGEKSDKKNVKKSAEKKLEKALEEVKKVAEKQSESKTTKSKKSDDKSEEDKAPKTIADWLDKAKKSDHVKLGLGEKSLN